MDRNNDNVAQMPVQTGSKRKYRAPVLRLFGSVTELTASNAGSCNNDGNAACKVGPSTMVMA